jgi:hypothetical protein
MPSWLLLLGQEQMHESQGSRPKDSNPPAWPRSEGMVFTSGLHQVAEVQSEGVKQVQLSTRRHDQTEDVPHSLSFIEPKGKQVAAKTTERIETLADSLQKLGISRERALLPELWQMRVAEEVAEGSDEGSIVSQEDVRKGPDTDDSGEEL